MARDDAAAESEASILVAEVGADSYKITRLEKSGNTVVRHRNPPAPLDADSC